MTDQVLAFVLKRSDSSDGGLCFLCAFGEPIVEIGYFMPPI